jgi:hypothetical protein
VFVRLNASALNVSFNFSMIWKSRNRLKSLLITPGPVNVFRPILPKRAVVIGANAVTS